MKIGIFFVTILICSALTTGVLFAQTTPTPTVQANPTPTTNVTQPPSTPAPTVAPTAQVTAVPSKAPEPTNASVQSQNSQIAKPTVTPTPLPPTPTQANAKPIVLAASKKPPVSPLSHIITAPFDLVMNSLPQSYYNDQGLTPTTTKVLLALALLSLASGTVLLKWPSLVKAKNRMFAPKVKEQKSFPYLDLTGRA
jgi:hypothetical protein